MNKSKLKNALGTLTSGIQTGLVVISAYAPLLTTAALALKFSDKIQSAANNLTPITGLATCFGIGTVVSVSSILLPVGLAKVFHKINSCEPQTLD